MDDVGLHPEGLQGLQDAAGEEDEPLGVVRIVLPVGRLVEVGTVEVDGVLDEVDRHVAVESPLEKRSFLRPLSYGHLQVDAEGFQAKALHIDRLVAGHDDGHLVAQGPQGLGQGARHVSQPAGLGKRRDFTRRNTDIHGIAHWFGTLSTPR